MSVVDTTGWPALARLTLRTSRRRLVAWPVITGFLVWVSASQIPKLYDTPETRAAYESTAGESAATKVFNGRGYGLDTVGGITAYELGFYTLVIFPVVALHLAIHLTRTQEASGRFDLLAAARLGRTAPLASAMVVLTGVMGLTALLTLVGLLVSDLGSGSWWYAGALFLQLIAVAALGLLVAQVATDGQQAHGLGLTVLGVLFLVRAVVDGSGSGPAWLSPLGWFAEVRPFGSPQVWPLIAYAVLAVVLLAAAAALNVRRDLGSGLLEPRPGPPNAGPQLGTPVGLAARLLRGVWLGWAVATTVWAFLLGVIAREMRELFESNPDMQAMLGDSGVDPEDLMISTGGFLTALLALGFVVQAVVRLAGEETEGRLGVVLATKVSRTEWWLGSGLTALAGGVAIQLLSAVALGAGLWVGTGEASGLATGIQVGLAFVSALLACGAACLLLSAVSARLAAAGWVVFGAVMTIDLLGVTLDLPEWTLGLSPFHLIGRPPVDPVSPLSVLLVGVAAVAMVGASLVLFRRRDLFR